MLYNEGPGNTQVLAKEKRVSETMDSQEAHEGIVADIVAVNVPRLVVPSTRFFTNRVFFVIFCNDFLRGCRTGARLPRLPGPSVYRTGWV